jgi:hypothetical protein
MSSIKITDSIRIPVTTTTVLVALLGASSLGSALSGALRSPPPLPVIGKCLDSSHMAGGGLKSDDHHESHPRYLMDMATGQNNRNKAMTASAACTPSSCPAANRTAYLESLNHYFAHRAHFIQVQNARYGDRGLYPALQEFSRFEDQKLEASVKAHLSAKSVTLRDFTNRGAQEAIGVLAAHGAQSVRPCLLKS